MSDFKAPFATISEAERAYFPDEESAGPTGDDGDGGWGELETVDELEFGWVLLKQERIDGSDRRFFLTRGHESGIEVIVSGGSTEVVGEQTPLEDVPSHPKESDARTAYEKWLDEHEEEERDDEEAAWSEWEEINVVEPWHIYGRSHEDGERVEFVVSGVLEDETVVYLGPNGDVRDEAHIYTSIDDVEAALEAYFQNVEDGNVPDDRQPTGDAPPMDAVDSGTPAPGSGGLVDRVTSSPALAIGLLGVAAGGYYAYQEGYL